MHPDIKPTIDAYNHAIGELRVQRRTLEAKENKLTLDKNEVVINFVRTQLANPPPAEDITLGNWECKPSPTGQCVYDYMSDPCLDDCLFCGHPSERK